MHSTQHILVRLLEEWRELFDHNKVFRTIFVDFSKAFNRIPHDLLIVRLNGYGFDKNTLTLLFSYLKNGKQSVGIKTNYTSFLELLSGEPQGSIQGALLFHIILTDFFLIIKKGFASQLY